MANLMVKILSLSNIIKCTPFLIFISFQSYGATDSLLVREFKIKNVREVKSDQLSNFYVITNSNVIEKYHAQKGFQKQFSSKRSGTLHSIDVSSPNLILCFYKEFGTIIIIDNQLSEVRRIELFSLGFFNVEAVCRSRDNGIWLLDRSDIRVKKLSYEGKLLIEGPQLNMSGKKFNVLGLFATSTGVVMIDSHAIHLVNLQLQFEKSFEILNILSLNIQSDKVVYLDSNSCVELDLKTLHKKPLFLPQEVPKNEIKKVLFTSNYVIYWTENFIKSFRSA